MEAAIFIAVSVIDLASKLEYSVKALAAACA
jgi:hypothetical protein